MHHKTQLLIQMGLAEFQYKILNTQLMIIDFFLLFF
jgi:hypothetical protein